MPDQNEVTLPRYQKPAFPQKCIVCGKPSPTGRVSVSTQLIESGKSVLYRRMSIGKPSDTNFSANAPACPMCAWQFRLAEFGGILLALLIAVPTLIFFDDELEALVSKRVLRLIVAAFSVGVYLACSSLFKVPLSLKAAGDVVRYQFADAEYKDEFQSCNPPLECVTLPPGPIEEEDNPFKFE